MYLGEMGGDVAAQIINTDTEDACKAAGGVVIGFVRQGTAAHDQYGRLLPGNVRCSIPVRQAAPPPSAPITVTVSPAIQTQVSPQISPAFQQQYQPTGSPMTAGTSQATAPGPIGVTSPAPAPAPAYIPPAPAYAPAQLPPAPAPIPAQSYSVTPSGMAPDQLPAAVAPTVPAPQPMTAGFDWKIAAILGLSVFGAVALVGKRK